MFHKLTNAFLNKSTIVDVENITLTYFVLYTRGNKSVKVKRMEEKREMNSKDEWR